MRILLLFVYIFLQGDVPLTILKGTSGLFTVYLDCNRDFYCVEIYGVKYGKLDTLTVIDEHKNHIVAKSREGYLEMNNNKIIYKNHFLHISVHLRDTKYSKKIDTQRMKLFEMNAFNQVALLKRNYQIQDNAYSFDWKVGDDYIFYRNSLRIDSTYISKYIMKFKEYLKQIK